MLLQHGAVIDEHDPLAREPLGDAAAVPAHAIDDRVPADQDARGDEPAREAGVGADHGVLDRVGDDQQQHQVEGGHLAELPRPGEAETEQQGEVNDGGAEGDVEEHGDRDRHAKLLTDINAAGSGEWYAP